MIDINYQISDIHLLGYLITWRMNRKVRLSITTLNLLYRLLTQQCLNA